jgi:lipoprotein-anchoring transpeptidase ErfK/SrfK
VVVVAGGAVVIGLALGLFLRGFAGATATNGHDPAATTVAAPVAGATPPVPARPVSATQLAALPAATTWGVVPGAPRDPDPSAVPSGELLSPDTTVPVYAAPGGPPIAALPAQQPDGNHHAVGPSTVPVIASTPGWAQVLLPSRPNGSTGWLATSDPHIRPTTSPYLIRIDRARFQLTLLRSGTPIGQWTVAVGVLAPVGGVTQSVTPAGRTSVIADIRVENPTYSPVILPLGTHSPIYDSYGGGPATVGLHTWTPDPTVYGRPVSHGCIRVPPAALQVLSTTVPIGTPVLIT